MRLKVERGEDTHRREGKEKGKEEEISPSVERIDTYYAYIDIDEVSRFVEIALLCRRRRLITYLPQREVASRMNDTVE